MSKTFWFSYSLPSGSTLDDDEFPNSPYSLTWNVGRMLRERVTAAGYDFTYVNLDDDAPRAIGEDDLILGHSWYPTGFLTMAFAQRCRAKFVLQPYQHDIVGRNESAWVKALFANADHLFFITGPYWHDTMHEGLYGDWKPKTTRLDMAVNSDLHPFLKRRWGKPNKRAVLSIGADIPYKGLDRVAELAMSGGFRLGYFGNAPRERFQHVPQFTHHAGALFTPPLIQQVADEYDFFVSLALGDANPTTLLETACWGLLGFCNPQSGYWPNDPFLALELDNLAGNLDQLDYWQGLSEYDLRLRSELMREHVASHYTWTRFCDTLWQGIAPYL